MAIFNVTPQRDPSATVTPLPGNAFYLSTLEGDRCSDPKLYQVVDQVVYHDGGDRNYLPGDTIYIDSGLVTKKNLTGANADYNIIGGAFLTLNSDSEIINSICT